MISLIEHDSPAARSMQTTPKCICKSEHHKVHALSAGKPLCGGGNGGKSISAWQTDIGPVSCEACRKIMEGK